MPSWVQPPSLRPDKDRLWDTYVSDLQGFITAIKDGDSWARDLYWGWIREDMAELWENVEDWASDAVEALDDWVEPTIDTVEWSAQYALDWALGAWSGLGDKIQEGWFTAVTWAEAKRDEVWDWTTDRYDDAKFWAAVAWDWVEEFGAEVWDWITDYGDVVSEWITDKSDIVWEWIKEKGDPLWDWLSDVGEVVEQWWEARSTALDAWVDTYMEFYQGLFEDYKDDVLDFFADPIGFVLRRPLLSAVEWWLYGKWFERVE